MERLRGVRWSAFWLSVPPWRALAEVLAFQAPVLAWTLWFQPRIPPVSQLRVAVTTIVLMGPCAILWCVFRMRRPPFSIGVRLLLYTLMGALIGLTPSVIFAVIWQTQSQARGPGAPRVPHFPTLWFGGAWLAAFTAAFLISRLGVRLLVIWNGLRRRHLVWALTHAHLMVVVLGAALFTALLAVTEVGLRHTIPFQLLPILFFIFLMTVFALLVVLPPSALFSYLFARHTTRRLRTLAEATTALRAGDYAVRVPVGGEDEVAQLQANFNAMAADLERAVRELEAERDTVATLLEARRQLVASVSHELRTPVATLRGYLESVRTHWDDAPPPTLRHDLQVMERETIHLQALINDLFTLARAEVGKLELRCAPTDVGMIARHVVETMAPLAWQGSRVEVAVEASPGLPDALVDPRRLEEVLRNLLHNAVRHTAPGGIVAVAVAAEPEALVVQVKDTGEGIPPEDLTHIFERFYRTDRARYNPESGSGLGLALVKELTEAMGGSVTVASTLGEGTCFTVRLPRAPTADTDSKPRSRDETPRTVTADLTRQSEIAGHQRYVGPRVVTP
jgi:signal transduction histidine kinase